jgi:hypothetical protein
VSDVALLKILTRELDQATNRKEILNNYCFDRMTEASRQAGAQNLNSLFIGTSDL